MQLTAEADPKTKQKRFILSLTERELMTTDLNSFDRAALTKEGPIWIKLIGLALIAKKIEKQSGLADELVKVKRPKVDDEVIKAIIGGDD